MMSQLLDTIVILGFSFRVSGSMPSSGPKDLGSSFCTVFSRLKWPDREGSRPFRPPFYMIHTASAI